LNPLKRFCRWHRNRTKERYRPSVFEDQPHAATENLQTKY